MLWMQLFGPQFEAQNFIYSMKIQDPQFGEFYYKGPVRSLDDNKDFVYETGLGLTVSDKIIKKISADDYFNFEVEIINLKNENEETESLVSESGSEILEQAPKVEPLQENEVVKLCSLTARLLGISCAKVVADISPSVAN